MSDIDSTELIAGQARARLRLTPWDERSFGFRTAEIVEFSASSPLECDELMASIDAWMRERAIVYSFGRVGTAEPRLKLAFQRNGYRFIETSLRMSRAKTVEWPRTPSSLAISSRPATPSDLERLSAIAIADFHHGRFLEDPTLDDRAARARTANWLMDLARGGQLHTALLGETVVGFSADRIDPASGAAEMILYGVSSDYPMLALPVWINALQRLTDNGARRYQAIVSAANIGVINLYTRLGFQVAASFYGFRKWHDHPER